MHHLPLVLIGLGCLLLAGCHGSSPQPRVDEREAPARALLGSPEAREVPIVRGDNGGRVSWNELVSRAAGADAVLIGELHGHPLGSAAAAAFWEDVLATPGVAERAALSMEFFERDEQALVDDYLCGLIDEPAFLSVKNRRTYAAYPFGQREMVKAAKARSVPVVAANAPRVYVRAARTDGYERLTALTPDQRRLFRIPDQLPPAESRYHKKFQEFMLGQGTHDRAEGTEKSPEPDSADLARVEAAFRSQSLWDWTMAESVGREVRAGRRPVVHVVGQFHTNHDGGLLIALRAIEPGARVLTLAFIGEESTELREEDRGAADLVIYTGNGSADRGSNRR